MNILAIESSCDETAASIVIDGRKIVSNIIDSQVETHALYGGVVPEIASRRHMEAVCRVTELALAEAELKADEMDAIAATCAPGLIGALLVGANFGKAYAYALKKPFIPVHHIRGHIAANYLAFPDLKPPFLTLVASGGHSLIVRVDDYTTFAVIGGTRDDAAGEAFDKVARVLGLGYPGGPKIDEIAKNGDPNRYKLPVSQIKDAPLDFSFSGLKTAVINLSHNAAQKGETLDKEGLAASFCYAVINTLAPRLETALLQSGLTNVTCAGGVAANSFLRDALFQMADKNRINLYLPPLALCGDNAAMIASQAYYEYLQGNIGGVAQNAFATACLDENICMKSEKKH